MIRINRIVAVSAAGLCLAGSALAEVKTGEMAPDFKLADQNGVEHGLSDYRGKAVVLEWTNPDCPYVKRHYSADTMEKLATQLGAKEVVWLAVNSTHSNTPEDTKKWQAEQGFAYPTLQDAEGTVGRLYGARTTPHMYVINAAGKLRDQGAIDDDPRGKSDETTNFVDGAVAKLLAGAAPDPSETRPYGCSVKYK